jgi:hypothetical protein
MVHILRGPADLQTLAESHPGGALTNPPPPSTGVYELTVASLPHHVATVRLFVSAVGRTAGLDVETIDDAKLAASELATAIVTAGDLPHITVRATPGLGHLTLIVGPWRDDLGLDEEFGPLEIAQALFEGTRVDGEFVVLPVEATGPDD